MTAIKPSSPNKTIRGRVVGAMLSLALFTMGTLPLSGLAILALHSSYSNHESRRATAERMVAIIPEEAGAVCRDGWISNSLGSGTCSWHGGVRYWTGDLRRRAQADWWSENGGYVIILLVLWSWGAIRAIRDPL